MLTFWCLRRVILKDLTDVSEESIAVIFRFEMKLEREIEVFMVKIGVEVFWVVTPCSVVVGYQHFRGSCCLQLHGEEMQQVPPKRWSICRIFYGVGTQMISIYIQ
jgi:hypothetical protein